MGGKKGILSAKEKEAAKAKEQASKAAAAKEDSEWDAAGAVIDLYAIQSLLQSCVQRN